MNKFSKILFMALSFIVISDAAFAADDCPKNVDTVYCKIAKETGGKVYTGDELKNIPIEPITPYEPEEPSHEYSPYSKDIGCKEWGGKRENEICTSLSDNLEWGWTGHATIAPGWKTKWTSVKNTYCDTKITPSDLPVLLKMCGSNVDPYMSCTSLPDARLAVGVEYLIKTLISLDKVPRELKGSVYDPQGSEYLLKDGCRE